MIVAAVAVAVVAVPAVVPVVVVAVGTAVIHGAVHRIRPVVHRRRAVVHGRGLVVVRRRVVRRVIRRGVVAARIVSAVAVDAVVDADTVARPVETEPDADVRARERGWGGERAGQHQAQADQVAAKNPFVHGCLRSTMFRSECWAARDEYLLSMRAFTVQLFRRSNQQPWMFGRRAKSGGMLARPKSSMSKRSPSALASSRNRRALLENTIRPTRSSLSAQANSSETWSRCTSKSPARLEFENVGGST